MLVWHYVLRLPRIVNMLNRALILLFLHFNFTLVLYYWNMVRSVDVFMCARIIHIAHTKFFFFLIFNVWNWNVLNLNESLLYKWMRCS